MKKTLALILTLALVLMAGSVFAEGTWPEAGKTITFWSHSNVGSNDLYIRALQPYLQEELGITVIIENLTGASGRVCANKLWGEAPDGYNIFSMTIPLVVASDVFYQDTNDYRVTGFETIYSFDCTPYALIVKKGSPYASMADLLEAAKGTTLVNATSGVGGSMHLQSVVLQQFAGVEFIDVPFDGSNAAMMAVMTGDADMCILPADIPLNNLEEVNVLAVFGKSVPSYYEGIAPCTAELGYDFTCLDTRRTIVAPPGTPQEILDTLEAAIDKAVATEGFQKWCADGGYVLNILKGKDVAAAIQETYDAVYGMKDLINLNK